MEALKLFGIGIIFGIANVIPGVSGGTIAVVFNVYDKIINVITLNLKKMFSQWKFLLPFGSGIVIGIILFSKMISILFAKFPVQTNWFFIGIILGSIPMIYKRMVNKTDESKKIEFPTISAIICCLFALALMIFMTITDVSTGSPVAQTDFSIGLAFKLFFALILAAIAMIIPGVSGSFLMLAVGVYNTVITAVADFNIPLLIPAAIGAIIGFILGAGLVRWLMAKFPTQTYGAILGLVLGSIFVIFPGFASVKVMAVSFVCMILGCCLSYFASKEKTT